MSDIALTAVDSSSATNTAGQISDEINKLTESAKYFVDEVVSELQPWWSGEAMRLFETQFTSFAEQFNSLVTEYDELNKKLASAGKRYEVADESVITRISKLDT